jgi:MarR family transcriptional regulator, lower aerobic nicotinate degradation pathway regulator
MDDFDLSRAVYAKPGHLIRRLQQIAVAVFLEETAPFDVTPVQYAALAAIRARPGIDQIRLAHAIGFDRTTIGGVVERLEAKGLITRETAAADRRAKLLGLTEAGRTALAAMAPAVERAQERILGGLGVEERPLFVDMLSRLVRLNNEVARVPLAAPQAE